MSLRERSKKLSKRDQKVINRVTDYQTIFNSEEGKRVLLDLMEQGFVLRPTQVAESEIASFINEGKRNIVLYILAQMETNAQDLMNRIINSMGEVDEFEN
jgi:hypothetical protein